MSAPPADPADPACDENAVKKSLQSDAWGKAFSLSTWVPLVGPSLGASSFGSCPVWQLPCSAKSVSASMQDDINDTRQKLVEVTGQWQESVTMFLNKLGQAQSALVATLPGMIKSKLDYALEPIQEKTIMLSVSIFFLTIIVIAMVYSYS